MGHDTWGDDDDGHVGYVTAERAEELFRFGAQVMRETLARVFAGRGDLASAALARDTWLSSAGNDPGDLVGPLPTDPWKA